MAERVVADAQHANVSKQTRILVLDMLTFHSRKLYTQRGYKALVDKIEKYQYDQWSGACRLSTHIIQSLDTALVVVPVVVTSPSGTSAPFQLRMETNSPAFLLFDTHGDIIARHLDAPNYSLLGPTSLYPGLTTPAKGGETIWLAGIGFGLPTTTLTDGSSSQSGPLATKPICFIGPNQATVLDASVVTPGLYILTVTVPTGTPSGDNLVTCTYQGNALFPSVTPLGNVINVR